MGALKLFFLFLIAPLVIYAATPSESVVKITSYYSTSSLQPRLGSGLVILWQGHKYVLTSDHVAYHSNRSFTHEITDEQGHKQTLEYFVSDAGRGLALLRFLTDDPSFVPFDLGAQQEDVPSLNEHITMIGYPADSDAMLIDKKGQLSNIKFPSELFVELPELMEVKGGYGEFGMSGGAGFSASGIYRGLISHQIVSGSNNTLLLIPANVVQTWLGSVLSADGSLKSPSPITLIQDPAQQVSDFPSYRTGNLYFAFSEPFGKGMGSSLVVMATKDKNTDTVFGGDQGSFANLVFKPRVSFSCMGFRTKEVLGRHFGSAGSLNGWLRLAQNPQIEPLWIYEGIETVTNVRKARALQPDFARLASELRGLQAQQLASYLGRIATLLEFYSRGDSYQDSMDENALGNWRFIKPKDIDYILHDAGLKTEWQKLAEVSLETRARQKLNELRAVMAELTY
ncbi:S1 family peptidase [Bdellovibrio sp. HCB337]|uniref:S1 family peptidase n=1 Tax=Bdellovibrio sp. HCB337 TaxID=3394358 RepID=UPI0039A5B08F